MAWDWQVFCKETTSGDMIAGCFGHGGESTYLNWILKAWGWTLSVAVLALIVALVVPVVVATLRPLSWPMLVMPELAFTAMRTSST